MSEGVTAASMYGAFRQHLYLTKFVGGCTALPACRSPYDVLEMQFDGCYVKDNSELPFPLLKWPVPKKLVKSWIRAYSSFDAPC